MKEAAVIRYGDPGRVAEVRPAFRQYLIGLKEQARLWASGPFAADSGALIVHDAESEVEARRLIEDDPFYGAGVFVSVELRAWNQVF